MPSAPGPSRRAPVLDGGLVVAAALLVHLPCVNFGFVGLDDQDLIVDDQAFLSRPSSLWHAFGRAYMGAVDAAHAYYRPIVTASYVLDAQWSGARAFGYHLTNVVLHAACCLAVWALVRRLDLGRGPAIVGALVFAVHPALAPAVAWIPGRNDALLALFAVGAWWAFLQRRNALHFVLFGLALLTKETAVVLPLVCSAHAWLLEPELARGRRLALHATGWLALVAARLAVHPPAGASLVGLWSAGLSGVVAGFGQLVLDVRPAVLDVAAAVPVWPGWVAMLAVALAAALVSGVRKRVVALGVAVTFFFLLPPALLTGDLVLDTRLYAPAVGVVIVLGEMLRALAVEARTLAAFSGVAVAALAVLTVAFDGAYRDRRAFAREAVADSPRSPLAHFCLGRSEQLDGDDDAALAQYRDALDLGAREGVHNNVAVIEMKRAEWTAAEQDLRAELASNPGYARAWLNLGIVLRHEDREAEACDAATRAVALAPGDETSSTEKSRDCASP
jgi:hypothetical protein